MGVHRPRCSGRVKPQSQVCSKIELHDQLANARRATVLQLPSHLPSTTAQSLPNDDEICAWIYMSSHVAILT